MNVIYYIHLISENEEELHNRLENGPRLKIPKVFDSSVESMTEDETDIDSDSDNPVSPLHQNKRKLQEEQHSTVSSSCYIVH